MCGITVAIRQADHDDRIPMDESPEWLGLLEQNAARGPDSQRREDITIPGGSDNSSIRVSFVASTLHLRGTTLVPQPHTSENSVFCWNGEVFEGLDVPAETNDGSVLFTALDAPETPEDICAIMSRIEGPYAFVFYQRKTKRLFFARDPLGRRSLLIRRPDHANPRIMLTSVSTGVRGATDFEEVDPRYIHCLDLDRLHDPEKHQWSFDNALTALERIGTAQPALFGKLARVNKTHPVAPQEVNLSGPLPDELTSAIQRFTEVLDRSVRLRVQHVPRLDVNNKAARVAVLYSGGIDCTMIAFLASRHIPLDEPIDLLNVAFENPRKLRNHNPETQSKGREKQKNVMQPRAVDEESMYKVPDRITGLEQLEELRALCPGRQWNFVEVDVDYAESSAAKEIIERIMFPSRTVMDLSLALALYFASRGIGKVRKTASGTPEAYTSSARIQLNGLGSDELLGGYSRHRSAFNFGSWQALNDELQRELDRLPSRNLGRDDRVISCHGKETRHPFLSLSVVEFIASLPVHLKVDPRLELGLGDKMLLRLAARSLGLELASRRKKKAMQFGSHSARMEGGQGGKDGERNLHSDI